MVLHIYKAEANKLDFKKVANELIQETLKKYLWNVLVKQYAALLTIHWENRLSLRLLEP